MNKKWYNDKQTITVNKTDLKEIKDYCKENGIKVPFFLTKSALDAIRTQEAQLKKQL